MRTCTGIKSGVELGLDFFVADRAVIDVWYKGQGKATTG